MTGQPPVVVFDFDLTLTRWDSADRFFRWLLARDPWRLALLLAFLPVLAPMLPFKRTRRTPIRFAIWIATLGRSREMIDALVDEHCQSLPSGKDSIFLPAAMEQLRSHVAQGHRVVIATGSLEPLAKTLLDRAGLGDIPLVASTLRPFLGGLATDQHCFGPNKIPMLAARGFPPPWSVAYTDHHADLPVLKLSAERFLISPKPGCVARIEAALSVESTILSWR